MEVVERLTSEKTELESRLNDLYHGGSQRKETLKHKIEIIKKLISAYQLESPLVNLSEAERILNQQKVGFADQNQKILNGLKIKKEPRILFLIGPPGVGKTIYAQHLSQALGRDFFSVALGEISDGSDLIGKSENSLGVEEGLLTKALLKTSRPLILLDEIDKVASYKGKSSIHDCLSNVLDAEQNKEVFDYYLLN